MKTKTFLVALFLVFGAVAFGQKKTSVSSDITEYLGTSTQQLEDSEEKVLVYTKDTLIYAKCGIKAYKYEKELSIILRDGQPVETYYSRLVPNGQRTAWEFILLYVYIFLSYYMIGRYKRLGKDEDAMIGLIFAIMFGIVILTGLLIAIGTGFSVGIALILAFLIALVSGLKIDEVLAFVLTIGVVLGLVLGLGFVLGLWWVFGICVLLATVGYLLGCCCIFESKRIINKKTKGKKGKQKHF